MANPTPSWDVISQQPSTGLNDHGQYVKGQEIRIRTGMGHEGTVFVPYADYDAVKAKAKLAALALRLDSVGSLSSKG